MSRKIEDDERENGEKWENMEKVVERKAEKE